MPFAWIFFQLLNLKKMTATVLIRLTMSSGSIMNVQQVMLYPEPEWQQVVALKSKAQEELGGYSTGLGFFGSPSWVIGGAAALGALESIVSSTKQKSGMRVLQDAIVKLQRLKENGRFFNVDEISGIESPNPAAWSATALTEFQLDLNAMRFMEKGEAMNRFGIKRKHISAGVATISATVPHIQYEDEFLWIRADDEPKAIRWAYVETYEVVS